MTRLLRYHVSMRRSIPTSIALLAAIAFTVVFVSSAHAQINTTSTSPTTQSRIGNHAVITPLAPNVVAPRTGPVIPRTGVVPQPGTPNRTFVPHHEHHRHHDATVLGYYPYYYPVPVPYADDSSQSDTSDAEPDAEPDPDYQGGPTIFDRRGTGADSYVPPVRDVPAPHASQSDDADPAPQAPQEPTLLVFKDGQKLEVGNYAIVGATLFDLTPGHRRKIMLADLDLDATQKMNDDRGVVFQLPPSS